MKIQGNISILISRESTTIEIHDKNAAIKFLTIELTPEQLSACLARQAEVECELQIIGLNNIGKKHENKHFAFEIPERLYGYTKDMKARGRELISIAQELLDKEGEGWVAMEYFGSKGSFYQSADGKSFARCAVWRWI